MRFGDVLILHKGKDGGPESKVDGFWLFRCKWLFTIALLRFGQGSRDAFHSHAFNSISWLLTGGLHEVFANPWWRRARHHRPSFRPIVTTRDDVHKVFGVGDSNWVLTFRGPWHDTWQEVVDGELITLTHNRKRVA